MNCKSTFFRYGFATLGLCLVALGIVFSVKANLGISVLNAPAYAINARTGCPLGIANTSFFMLCVLFQFIIIGKRFKAIDLLQILANALLGLMIDVFSILFNAINLTPEGTVGIIIFIVLSIVIQALGISMEVESGAWMLPADMTVRAIGMAWGGEFSNNKIRMDCSILIIAALMCWIFFGNILGPSDQPIIGWGTLILAIFIGLCMKITTPMVEKMLD